MSQLFYSSAICEISKSGNICAPDFVAIAINYRKARNNLYIYMHEYLNCLVVVDDFLLADRLARFERRRAAEDGTASPEQLEAMRRDFGFAAHTRLDQNNNIYIPPWMDQRREGVRSALIVGMGHGFEVWDLEYALNCGRRELVLLAGLHLNPANADITKGSCDEASVRPVRARHFCGVVTEPRPRLPVHALHTMQPRPDSIDRRGQR